MDSNLLHTRMHEAVALVKLQHGVTNPLGPELVDHLARTLHDLQGDDQVRAVVLAGSNEKFFSIGLELPVLMKLDRPSMGRFFRSFNSFCEDLFRFPKPLVGALTGHAPAGGAILAFCCDYRIMNRDNKRLGLNEIHLGLPVPSLAHQMLRHWAGERGARRVLDGGELFLGEDCLGMGLVDELQDADQVIPRALALAGNLGDLDGKAYAANKRVGRYATLQRSEDLALAEEAAFLECWFTEPTQAKLRVALEKF